MTMSESSLGAGRNEHKSIEQTTVSPAPRDSVARRSGSGHAKSSELFRGTDEAENAATGKKGTLVKSVRRQESIPNAHPRLLVVSSKIKNNAIMNAAILANVTYVQYKYETATLDGILGEVICYVQLLHALSNKCRSCIYK